MIRITEPEVMLEKLQCTAYATSPATKNLKFFILDKIINLLDISNQSIADLGAGPCELDILLCKQYHRISIDAYDASIEMIDIGNKNIIAAGLSDSIKTHCCSIADIKKTYDVVISSAVLHHFQDPMIFWSSIKKILNPGGQIFIFDLIRPDNSVNVQRILNATMAGEDPLLIRDFKNSLYASFTVEEIVSQIKDFDFLNFEIIKADDRIPLQFICISGKS
jgi:2-polyprenyl-3-methyl-5-hydroxy-6-metoxy-1,4-benzoquinol methylase